MGVIDYPGCFGNFKCSNDYCHYKCPYSSRCQRYYYDGDYNFSFFDDYFFLNTYIKYSKLKKQE